MSAATISAIEDALKAALATITGLRAYDDTTGSVPPPAAIVGLQSLAYDATMARGSDDYTFRIVLLLSDTTSRIARDDLNGYIDPKTATSVKYVIENNAALSALVDVARVAGVRHRGLVEWAGQQYLGAELLVEVTT